MPRRILVRLLAWAPVLFLAAWFVLAILPSRIAGICLLLFLLPFAIYGLWFVIVWCIAFLHDDVDWRALRRTKAAMTDVAKEKYAAQLATIGDWSDKSDRYELELHWPTPKDLTGGSIAFRLVFRIDSVSGNFDPDDRMFALWQRYSPRHPAHLPDFEKRIVDRYRETDFSGFLDRDVEYYPADLPEADILRMVQGKVEVSRTEYKRQLDYSLQVGFFFGWDEEHGYHFLEYDEERDRFEDEWEE